MNKLLRLLDGSRIIMQNKVNNHKLNSKLSLKLNNKNQ